MLESIHLKNVGPAPEMQMDLAPRLNLITGDNGLGKSFLLDVAWWALTRTWAREMVVPKPGADAQIAFAFTTKSGSVHTYASRYQPGREHWGVKVRPNLNQPIPGLILYAQVDGGFSVWDPARNYGTGMGGRTDGSSAFLFTAHEVWRGNQYCKGLIDDWALWQAGSNQSFHVLTNVLDTLSPTPTERLLPGDLRKLTVKDPQRYPTLRMPYGEDVAVIHASAGMRRIIALAYLLTWAWQEHVESAKLRGQKSTREIVFLIDEIEGHLHPQWQRRIVPALLNVMGALTGNHGSKVQLIVSTHAPLVLASVEPTFDAEQDAWFDLDLEQRQVVLRKRPYVRHGEIGNWLVSEAFDLKEPRSLEGEQAIAAAQAVLDAAAPTAKAIGEADQGLRKAGIPDIDPFWVQWGYFKEQHAKSSRTSTAKGNGKRERKR
jgi:predicted ATPase